MSRPTSWVGPATRDPGTTAGLTLPAARHETYGRELAHMLELICSGEAFDEPITAERLLVRLVSVLTQLHEGHQVDDHGRCSICRPRSHRWWRPWPRRAACTVHAAFASYLAQANEDLRRAP